MEWKILGMVWNGRFYLWNWKILPAVEDGRFTFHSIVCPAHGDENMVKGSQNHEFNSSLF